MSKQPTAVTPENIENMAKQMAQYVQHQSIQYDVSVHYMEDGKLIEQSPVGVKKEIPLTKTHFQTA
jgi:hypothetical protein